MAVDPINKNAFWNSESEIRISSFSPNRPDDPSNYRILAKLGKNVFTNVHHMHYDTESRQLILLIEEYEVPRRRFVPKLYRLKYSPSQIQFEHFASLVLPEEIIIEVDQRTRPLQKIISCRKKLHIIIAQMGNTNSNSTDLYSFTANSGNVTDPYDFDNANKTTIQFPAGMFIKNAEREMTCHSENGIILVLYDSNTQLSISYYYFYCRCGLSLFVKLPVIGGKLGSFVLFIQGLGHLHVVKVN